MQAEAVLQSRLGAHNRQRLLPTFRSATTATITVDLEAIALERSFVEAERAAVRARAGRAPTDAAGFLRWFEDLEISGPGQGDPLFRFLEHEATRDQMIWFLQQEIAGEAGFDDLVALTQVKMPTRVKMELARNYWDEMGRGQASGMHGELLLALADEIGIGSDPEVNAVWEALALSNLMMALASNRHYAYEAIGALGVVELTAPGRSRSVNAGLKRLGFDGEARRYFALHSTLDVKHSAAWNREILAPLVESDPKLAQPIAEGALMRLRAGARCFERYRNQFLRPSSSDCPTFEEH